MWSMVLKPFCEPACSGGWKSSSLRARRFVMTRKQHVDVAQKGNRSVVFQESIVAFLEELWNSATTEDGIKELLKDFKYPFSTRFQKLRCNSILIRGLPGF
ncbi:unnamed protein product [Parnassius mnemosyne]|uniref:Uncharacterized protein n=1 Tax=Parnassius mnemosyne TaxID=213953 RepID=A0AAV1LUU0_9NEOP